MTLLKKIEGLYARQLSNWSLAHDNYTAVAQAPERVFSHHGRTLVARLLPCRHRSATAEAGDEEAKRCFLCAAQQPPEQEAITLGNRLRIQVNPYPIFTRHLTVSAVDHRPQAIVPHIEQMMDVAALMPGYVLFYNGPRCGASAPRHLHFQAVPFAELPLCRETIDNDADLSCYFPFLYIIRKSKNEALRWFHILQDGMTRLHGDKSEPMQNVFCHRTAGQWHIIIVPRAKHRPACYGTGPEQFLISPAAVEMGGIWPIVREEDFKRVKPELLYDIGDEVGITEDEKDFLIDYFSQNV